MPRRPAPLPPSIDPAAFTVDDARRAGVSWSRLQSSDLRRLRHGLDGPAGDASPVREWTMDEVRAYQRHHPDVVVSHETAARLHGLTVPERLLTPGAVHVSVGTSGGRPAQAGLVPHRIAVPEGQRMERGGVLVTTPARTLWDLCAARSALTERDVVVAGDALLCPPWLPDGGRGASAYTPAELVRSLAERGRFRGRGLARAALARMRVGADSPRETRLRLALVDAGLPEPEVQCRLDPADRHAPTVDLGYRRWRLALQYEGEHHRTAEQQARDVLRDRWCTDHDWLPIKVMWADARDDYAGVVARVRRRAAEFDG